MIDNPRWRRAGALLRLPGDRDRYVGRVDDSLTVLTTAIGD